mmetsp:Transcript_18158/g.28885  ORF Transcript_18158/g.28885 Transcript_18158/m.28885 type:complete len:102 (+) Transcript_18158:289-594(+)
MTSGGEPTAVGLAQFTGAQSGEFSWYRPVKKQHFKGLCAVLIRAKHTPWATGHLTTDACSGRTCPHIWDLAKVQDLGEMEHTLAQGTNLLLPFAISALNSC